MLGLCWVRPRHVPNAAAKGAVYDYLLNARRFELVPLWQSEIEDEKILLIQVAEFGGGPTSAYTRETAAPTSYPQILVKRQETCRLLYQSVVLYSTF